MQRIWISALCTIGLARGFRLSHARGDAGSQQIGGYARHVAMPAARQGGIASKSTGKREEGHRVVIVGGGTGGISVAAQLRNEGIKDVCIVEPSDTHYYQPMWSLIGGGEFTMKDSARPMASVIPPGVRWLQERVSTFQPRQNTLRTAEGTTLSYDYLVVSAGLQLNWKAIPGLTESLGKFGVCSIYSQDYAEYTWETLRGIKSGTIVGTQPPAPIKCAGAPQKIMWLAEDYFRKNGRRDDVELNFALPNKQLFGIKRYSDVLTQQAEKRGLNVLYEHRLTRVDGPKRVATFKGPRGDVRLSFDMLHVVPPQSALDFIKASPLSNSAGYVDVDRDTLQHKTYPNVFALGDCSSLPTSKTMAAITAEAPVLVHNLIRAMNGRRCSAVYSGYASCPVVLGYNSLLLTEFVYDGVVSESFSKLLPFPPFDQGQPSWFYFLVKKYVFPFAYYNLLTKGRWYGPRLVFKPNFDKEDAKVDAADGRLKASSTG